VLVVGLTGGIGSGKSTVADGFAARGAVVIDADRVAREVVEPGEPALAEIAERFGPEVIDADGRLDRAALAAIVFADATERGALEAITHPRIGERIAARLRAVADEERRDGRQRVVVLDHPLLVEQGLHEGLAAVVVVTAPAETRIERLVAHRGMDAADARARIAAQTDDEARRAIATHVIDNSGDRDALAARIDQVWADLTAPART
jgi:dephospho-CoA kinase